MTFDHVFDKVIFDEVITLMETFNVVMVCKFLDVLFAFRCCDFRSSDLFPKEIVRPGVLESGFSAGDHVELVSGEFQRFVKTNCDGNTELVLQLKRQ